MTILLACIPPSRYQIDNSEHWVGADPHRPKRWRWIAGAWQPAVGGPITPRDAGAHGYRWIGRVLENDPTEEDAEFVLSRDIRVLGPAMADRSNDNPPPVEGMHRTVVARSTVWDISVGGETVISRIVRYGDGGLRVTHSCVLSPDEPLPDWVMRSVQTPQPRHEVHPRTGRIYAVTPLRNGGCTRVPVARPEDQPNQAPPTRSPAHYASWAALVLLLLIAAAMAVFGP